MNDQALCFVPLGGAGEIGMNLNVYAWRGRLMVVDCGITFSRRPGGETDISMPDPTWLVHNRDRVDGMVLTHVHEDHIGAVTAIWPLLRCPVYATPFAAAVLRAKLQQAGLTMAVPLREIQPGQHFHVGPFGIRMIGITHSTVESQSLVIETDLGRVLHTGDWKLDPRPLVGPPTDVAALQALGRSGGVLAVISDSTNATKPGRSGSESDVRAHLMRRCAGVEQRVVAACFASNIARIQTLFAVAEACERSPVLMGRSLHRMVGAAQACGHLPVDLPLVPAEHAGYLPRERVMFICTGTQGEPRAAMARLATDRFRHMMLDPGDVALFSSKIIPGNEQPIAWLHGCLSDLGVEVISEEKEPQVHVSGHPCQDELAEMYEWVQPQHVVPVHGTDRHLDAHASLACTLGFGDVQVRNGDMLQLAPGPPRVIERVRVGRVPRPDVESGRPFERRHRGGRRRAFKR